ncbi:MAG: hypothetical protein BGN87_22120 [Rhizobiales bacterium 65-79]|jgi:hypothetical protein|nr:DUF2489 domain-containing protein [Hyphomicrobiales bacterium]OJU00751.1 MAG: hypothetical protein BGN87_22120 [Rhizobiales bacterium 65-79]
MNAAADYVATVRKSIVDTARKMLGGECSYIEGSRVICGLLDQARLDSSKEPFLSFVSIDSETDDVPLGQVRECWSEEARAKFLSKWDAAEDQARKYGEPACQKTIMLLLGNAET